MKTQNINFSGDKNNVQFGEGDNHMQVSQSSGGELTAKEFFEAIAAETNKLPEADRAVVSGAVEPLKDLATAQPADPAPTSESPKPGCESTLKKYLDILRPHAALIVKCVAAFSEASLTALASSNPVVAGVLAVAKEVRSAN